MTPKKPKTAATEEGKAPWAARGVRGVTPPGRRLGPLGEKRRARWSASSVDGIAPPGKTEPGQGPAAEWIASNGKPKRAGTKKRGKKDENAAGRPTAGFVPDPSAGTTELKNLKAWYDEVVEFFKGHPADDETIGQIVQLIAQSHAPFELLVAGAVLTAHVGADGARRKKHQWSLERGMKVFFNLSKRLDPSIRPPRGLVPRTVDPLFYDLPRVALQIPYAYGTHAFLRMLDLLRQDHVYNRALINFARKLWAHHLEGRSFGDKALVTLFPWEEPSWADQ